MTATEAAFTCLVDYAGLFPPAALDMRSAVRNYLAYRGLPHAWMLGRFIVDITKLDEVKDAAADEFPSIPLSVIAPADFDARMLARRRDEGFRIDSIEIKCHEPLKIARVRERVPEDVECYFEIPAQQACTGAIDALAAVNARAKLRMGGIVAEAFPTAIAVAERMETLADRGVAFKATAGLHHPLRSEHRLTYAENSPAGAMHGFVNLLCAAPLLRFGGERAEAVRVLEERDANAFAITRDSVVVYQHAWDAAALSEVRQFFVSFGSCSFTEPTSELEALGWL
ncbi:MAG TPA: hypothetical protein VFE01_10555 [Terracidiphilus sp.]|jgi:hypothetical protein|nr:hypothetical protein [Terracidiphilus sp.]